MFKFVSDKKSLKPLDLPINYDEASWPLRKKARIQYVKEQKNKCHHCGRPLTCQPDKKIMKIYINTLLFPDGFFNNSIHLHHDHKTGLSIGAVHARCNAYLWQYEGE